MKTGQSKLVKSGQTRVLLTQWQVEEGETVSRSLPSVSADWLTGRNTLQLWWYWSERCSSAPWVIS